MGIMDDRKNKESKIIKKTCFYPLNQFHQQFVNTAKKGCSEINWHNLIESLQNDVEDEENDININENEFNINESINENLNLEDQTINE